MENIYKIISPPFPGDAKTFSSCLDLLTEPMVLVALEKANAEYLHWDKLKYKSWIPKEFFPDKEQFWRLLKFFRLSRRSRTPIKDARGKNFTINVEYYSEFLHMIDKEMAGSFMGISDFSENDKKQFVTRNIIEEAIASSQLEGANTSRAVAKRMLLEGRKPQTHGEQMILNNHRTMLKIEQKFCKEDLSWNLMCELHSMITENTLSDEKQGKLRETLDEHGNKLKIMLKDGTITYIAPDKEFVEGELPRLIDFANDKVVSGLGKKEFIHPLIKAIMLHFWVGLLHPFEDGNGRLARIIFYWYLLKNEYWAFAYLSLSEKIKKSPEQYAMAYVYSEQDDCDLNYFIHYNISKLMLAREAFQSYVQRKINENRAINASYQQKYNFNERQIRLLHYLNQRKEEHTNLMTYQKLYSVKKGTAVADLKALVDKGFLEKRKRGRNIYYFPMPTISKLFKN